MSSDTLENEARFLGLVNQQPVGFEMALPPASVVADKPVITVYGVKRFAGKQYAGNNFELLQVFAAPLRAFDVPLKLFV
jgi:hypothetical protein